MKKIFIPLTIILLIISLGLNIILLYSNLEKNKAGTNCGIKEKKNYSKEELGELFKEYQITNNLVDADNVAVWNVDKIIYKGFFMSDGRKLYYFNESFKCLEGISCIKTPSAKIDGNYLVNVTYVVAVDDSNEQIKFYILDESILNDKDFINEKEYEL